MKKIFGWVFERRTTITLNDLKVASDYIKNMHRTGQTVSQHSNILIFVHGKVKGNYLLLLFIILDFSCPLPLPPSIYQNNVCITNIFSLQNHVQIKLHVP